MEPAACNGIHNEIKDFDDRAMILALSRIPGSPSRTRDTILRHLDQGLIMSHQRFIRLPGDERCLAVAIDVQSELRALLKRSKAGG
jgi:hypothetical protein